MHAWLDGTRHGSGEHVTALQVLSVCEGRPTLVAEYIPHIHIVPPESADPGFGSVVVIPEADHIGCCKPRDKEDPIFTLLLERIMAAGGQGVAGGPGSGQGNRAVEGAGEAGEGKEDLRELYSC